MLYGLMKWLKVPHNVAAPGALIGASNFFELAVARRRSPSTVRARARRWQLLWACWWKSP
jgi:hypothetical protein